jgi:THO complex subunit 2
MAPGGKRKRGDGNSNDAGSRPSPHRPQNMNLARGNRQQQQSQQNDGRNSRRGSRVGSASTPQSPVTSQTSPTAMSTPTTMPPPKLQVAPPSTPKTPVVQQNTMAGATKVCSANEYLTPARVEAWNGEGRSALVQDGIRAQADGDMFVLALLFDDLVQACIEHSLGAVEAGSVVRDILAASTSDEVDGVSLFLDTVSNWTDAGSTDPSIRVMLEATNIDPARLRAELESSLLISLNLVRSTFPKMAIRKATHALYRQSNYNLLREETEGYSKLITEYFTTVNSQPPNQKVVGDTFERVTALIGAFDLDVGRVLDVTLDVFANLLVKYTRFFVKFLRTSSWWPELKVTHGIEWEEPKVSTLPLWALPESFDWFYTDAGREEQYRRHQERDAEFWKRVEELQGNGMKAYFELGARRITSGLSSLKSKTGEVMDVESSASTHQTEKEDASKKDDLGADFEKIQQWSQDWMAQTHTLPPLGNRIAAQLLGFKLRFYASDARDANDTLPDNLIYLSALLIKIGFISMADLYPHLYPLDEDMDSHMDRLLKEQKEREDKLRGISNNALAMAGALPDDMPPVPASVTRLRESENRLSTKPESQRGTPPPTEETKAKLPEPVDQKVALLRSLLCIGAIPEALFILGRFPKLLEVYPDLYDYLNRLANHSLNKVYEWARPFPQHLVPITPKSNGQSMPHSTDYIPRRTLRWAKLEERDASEGIDYRFYWDDWADNTPVCQNVDDVFSFYKTFLVFVGPGCGRDATVLTKLARIGKKSLAEDPSPENWRRWTALSGRFLVPALSFSGQNPGAVSEVWELIKQFDTRTRYEIYYNWCPRKGKQDLRVKAKNAEIKAETTRLFSRVSTENTREMARLIAKPALACPGIVLREAQNKAEAYVNLGEPLVECCRYLTYLGYDCLNWVFIDSLTENARLKKTMQGDGMVTSMWLQNTALFIAKTYKRYSLMDSTPVLQFVTDKLLQGRKIEYLEILEQLITLMAGIGPVLAVPEAQVFGLSVGPLLRAYTLEHYLGDKRHQAKSTAKRLLKHLRDAELAPQILIALAQELEEYAFREEHERKNANPDEGIEKQDATPLKVIGWKLDNLYSKFTQFLDFLRTYLSVEEFDAMVPGVVELVSEFNLSPSLAFAITRTSLSAKINSSRVIRKNDSDKAKRESLSPSKSEGSIPTPTQANGDVTMGGVEDESMANGTSMTDNPAKKETSPDDAEMKDAGALAEDEVNESTGVEQASTPNGARKSLTTATGRTDPAIEALAHHFKMAMPETYGNHMCLEFFVTFWQLSFFDIHTVTTMKNMSEYSAASKHYSTEATKVSLERRDLSTQAVAKRKAEIQGYNDQSDAMRKEAHESYQAALKTQQHLKKEMNQWFEGISMMTQQSKELHMVILQDCFLPRIMASSQDAQFASAMLKFMHEAGVPGFRTSKLLDILFTHPILTNVIFMCTSREAQNLGRFLNDVLKDLNLWHKDEVHYTRNSQGQKKSLPGFAMKYNPAGTPVNFLDHKDFKKLLNKWHSNIFKALETCFKSDEPMHIRNAINVLKAISSSFPKIDTTGKSLNQLVQHLSQHDSRPDIKLAATSLLGDLKKGESTWISAEVFKGEPAPAPVSNSSRTNTMFAY